MLIVQAEYALLLADLIDAAEGYLTITTYDQDPRTWNATVFGACNELAAVLARLQETQP